MAPIPLAEAVRRVEASLPAPVAEAVRVDAALGRLTAAPVSAREPLPGFDNAAMDGFAVRAADTPGVLRIAGESRAGHPAAAALGPGEAIPISTGAMMPPGADAVLRIEDARVDGSRVGVAAAVEEGHDLRRRGEEVEAGGPLVAAGARLGPVELAALAAAGVAEVRCLARPRVAVLATGDELTGPGETLPPGAIRDSNRTMLVALARRHGAEVVSATVAGDDEDAIARALAAALGEADVVLSCGGMSVGPHDHVRAAWAAAGVEPRFAGVAIAPGRPVAYGTGPAAQRVLGMPGTPMAALAAFHLLGLVALRAPARIVALNAAGAFAGREGRTRVVACRVTAAGAEPLAAAGSGPVAALGADGLALVDGSIAPGERVDVLLLLR